MSRKVSTVFPSSRRVEIFSCSLALFAEVYLYLRVLPDTVDVVAVAAIFLVAYYTYGRIIKSTGDRNGKGIVVLPREN